MTAAPNLHATVMCDKVFTHLRQVMVEIKCNATSHVSTTVQVCRCNSGNTPKKKKIMKKNYYIYYYYFLLIFFIALEAFRLALT